MNVQACEKKWSKLNISCEPRKSFEKRLKDGFFEKYLKGKVIDIGYKGYEENTNPVVEWAIGVDLDYPGYDGKKLPFEDESIDSVFSSHVLEHIEEPLEAIREWFRVLKIGGYLIIIVPHRDLYEKKLHLPSKWNADHKRFYTPSSLLNEIELSLEINSYRIRYFEENDFGFDYTIGADRHSDGCYEIVCVVQKIEKPKWDIEKSYIFKTPNGDINTLKIVKKIESIIKNKNNQQTTAERFIFISEIRNLINELSILQPHLTLIKNELIDNLKKQLSELIINFDNEKTSTINEDLINELKNLSERLLI